MLDTSEQLPSKILLGIFQNTFWQPWHKPLYLDKQITPPMHRVRSIGRRSHRGHVNKATQPDWRRVRSIRCLSVKQDQQRVTVPTTKVYIPTKAGCTQQSIYARVCPAFFIFVTLFLLWRQQWPRPVLESFFVRRWFSRLTFQPFSGAKIKLYVRGPSTRRARHSLRKHFPARRA